MFPNSYGEIPLIEPLIVGIILGLIVGVIKFIKENK